MDIYTKEDLNKLIHFNEIKSNIIIRNGNLISLDGVETIIGDLGIYDSNIQTLGSLKYITGDFWINNNSVPSKLKSLGNLIYVGGNIYIRHSILKTFGNIESIGGKLDVKNTPIEDMGIIKYIGSDLFLPYKLKKIINESSIKIGGKKKFWNEEVCEKTEIKEKLIKYNNVPYWEHRYIFSHKDLKSANFEQQQFYSIFKENFLKNRMLDIEQNDNYPFVLFYDFISEFEKHKDIDFLQIQLNKLSEHYPITKSYIDSKLIELFEKISNYESSWNIIYNNSYISIETILEYQKKLHRPLLDGHLIIKLVGCSSLTKFGKKNIEKIKSFIIKELIMYEKENNKNFFEIFYNMDGKWSQIKDDEYYRQFFKLDSEYETYRSIEINQYRNGYGCVKHYVIERAIINQFKILIRQAENSYRVSINMPKIGEGWVSETNLYNILKNHYENYKVIHNYSSKWLGRQHIDIFFPDFNIGIEYQGSQHYRPVDYFGGQEAFIKNMERDRIKKIKCDENNCTLIYVKEEYNIEDVISEINKIIKDLK